MFQILKWLEENLPSFEYFSKNTLTICLRKAKRNRDSSSLSLLIRYSTHAPWITTSTIQTNWNHHHFFIRIPILGHVLVHSIDKINVLILTVKLISLLFLNILIFNFVTTPNKSLRFTRSSTIYVNRTAAVLTNHCQSYIFLSKLLFLLMCAVQSGHVPFLQLFVPNHSAFA